MPGGGGDSRLTEVSAFGANPGELRMLSYTPPNLPPGAPLVVVLHGCTQTAGGFDTGTGWSTLAERHQFALLMPEQRRANNPNLCFNWFEPSDITRGSGEVASIRSMVSEMVSRHRLDAGRVFVTGLSAGGAMTAALLATYPDTFAAGAIIAGLPFGCAANVREAMSAMSHCPSHTDTEWGERVRRAAPTPTRRPRVSIWHGGSDTTVAPSNALESAKQWCNVHGLAASTGAEDKVDGTLHRSWSDRGGVKQVELFVVAGLGHAVPIDTRASGDRGVGQAMQHITEAGVSSTWRIARTWGLVPDSPTEARSAKPHAAPSIVETLVEGPREVIARALRAAGLTGG